MMAPLILSGMWASRFSECVRREILHCRPGLSMDLRRIVEL